MTPLPLWNLVCGVFVVLVARTLATVSKQEVAPPLPPPLVPAPEVSGQTNSVGNVRSVRSTVVKTQGKVRARTHIQPTEFRDRLSTNTFVLIILTSIQRS